MTTSRSPAAIDALFAALAPSTALAAANAMVWDGPAVTGDIRDCIYLGYDGDPLGERRAIQETQFWAGIGTRKRTQTIDITCAIAVLNGDGDTKSARTKAYELMRIVEDILIADPSLGQAPTPFVAAITSTEMFWDWVESGGLQARLVFHVSIETRI